MILKQAVAQTISQRRLWIILYLISWISALLLIAFPASLLYDATTFTALADAADGIDFWQMLEIAQSGNINAALNRAAGFDLFAEAQTGLVSVMAGAIGLSFLLSAFLRGGVLSVLKEGAFFGRFLPNARRYFGSMIFLQIVHFLLILLSLIVSSTLISALGEQATLPAIVVGIFLLLFWIMWIELAAATLIKHNRRNPIVALSQGFRTIFRRPIEVFGFYLAALAIMTLLQYVFRFLIHPSMPVAWWLLVLIVHQLSIFLRIGVRIMRYAGALELATPVEPTPETPFQPLTEAHFI